MMTVTPREPTCWAISDGAAGNERQAVALARAVSREVRVVRIRLRAPWRWLAPRLLAGAAAAIRTEAGDPLGPPWPDLAIGCGRRAALVTRWLRGASGGRTFTVQILDPRIATSAFDLVVAPQHDALDGANTIRTIASLNDVDAAWLAEGRRAFPALAALPTPRTVVLIGASHRAQPLDAAYVDALVERLAAWWARDGGSFLVTLSRRTPPDLRARWRAAFARFPGAFWADAHDGENPYAGFLASADRIVVTPDSANMLSEACATGRPVYTFAPRPIRGKLAALHDRLRASGHVRDLGDVDARPWPPPLDETREVAELVLARWRADRPR